MILTLGQLAAVLDLPCTQPDIAITSITCDSRQVQPGTLFVAYPGVSVDGHRFITQAVAAGASAVVGEQDLRLDVPYLRVEDGRRALGHLAAAWEGYPSRRMGVIGITGTDGKTTTSNILHSILRAAGHNAGLVTTVSAQIGDRALDTGLHTTTPDAPDLQRYLRQMADAGSKWVVLETTSHGLSQWRVAGTDYDIAVYTNVTHEHLDEHGNYDGYLAAKGRLLELLSEAQPKPGIARCAVLNADCDSYPWLRQHAPSESLGYGINQGDVRATDIVPEPDGLRFTVRWDQHRTVEITTPLVGLFNIYNSLAAVTVAFLLEISDEAIQQGMATVPGIPGRMERIVRGQAFTTMVDFAHTPFALEAALQTVRGLTVGRVIVVFGSAGLRDVEKRRMMGEIAGRLADLSIVTAEDPRTEDLAGILDTERGGLPGSRRNRSG